MATRQHRETIAAARRLAARSSIAPARRWRSVSRRPPSSPTRGWSRIRKPPRSPPARRSASTRRAVPAARRPLHALRLRAPQGRSAQGGAARERRRSRGSASTSRSCAPIPRAASQRTCSATRASTTAGSRGSSGRSTASWPAGPGSETIVRDPFGRAIDIVASRPERPGRNVRLTIDHQIQASAEAVLGDTVRSWGAKGATAVVLDVRTGAVLAMANAPAFDANRFAATTRRAPAQPRRHRRVRAGSTFKLVTIAAALEDGVVTPTTPFVLPAADPGRRPLDPRGARARHGADDGAADPRQLVERRHRHHRGELGRGRACRLGHAVWVRTPDRDRLPGREPRHGAAARRVVRIDDRHGPDRPGHRGHTGADGDRVRRDRQPRRDRRTPYLVDRVGSSRTKRRARHAASSPRQPRRG